MHSANYYDAVNYLYGLQKYGIKLGLKKTEDILSKIGNPHKNLLSVHVAGTNGKGSVSAMIASILMAQGFKVGLFTSPHLVSFTERIRINNKQISESEVVSLTNEIRFEIRNSKFEIPEPTFFEFVTAMAFLYFVRNKIDWAVIETGMGGRLDATNVITPAVSVITRIGYDHKEFLGETLSDIAKEKAGIIKRGIPVVSAQQEQKAEDVIFTKAKEENSPIVAYGKDFKGILKSSDINGIGFDYHDPELITHDSKLENLFVPLPGEHQLFNACIAIKAAMLALMQNTEYEIRNLKLIREGLASTKWHGRLEIVKNEPLIMIDGAHNPEAANALSDFIRKHLGDRRIILIIGIMSDKDIDGILRPLLSLASDVIFTTPDYGRAASPEKLSEYAASLGYCSKVTGSVKEAIDTAIKISDESSHSLILITGSFYTIGEAMETLGENAIMGDLRETV
ncbi:MAG: folylpolyglutamate synthase/dihydrofolate synthase family protein [Thermodesulfovibrionales bacterium]|nr:folylpolyglutamate synthase/dihydrofolate synthase family protein [Thermodesulfovibrionales bacterium]